MPNKVGSAKPGDLETAHNFGPGRFAGPEPQERRGAPGSRDRGEAATQRERAPAGPRKGRRQDHGPGEWTGVNPLPPIDPAMPVLKPGDQAG